MKRQTIDTHHHHHHQVVGLNSPTSPGATSVWVGAHPPPGSPHRSPQLTNCLTSNSSTKDLNRGPSRPDSESADRDGQYLVVSVRDSFSDSEPGSRQNSSGAPPPPAALSRASSFPHMLSDLGEGTKDSSSSSSGPSPSTPPPFSNGAVQTQHNPYHPGDTSHGTMPAQHNPYHSGTSHGTMPAQHNPYHSGTSHGTMPAQHNPYHPGDTSHGTMPAQHNPYHSGTSHGTMPAQHNPYNSGTSHGTMPAQHNPYHMGAALLAGNTSNILGSKVNVITSSDGAGLWGGGALPYNGAGLGIGLLYNGAGDFLPAATSSMAALPQGEMLDVAGHTNPLLLQQQYVELLAASLGQTLTPSFVLQPQPLYISSTLQAIPQPQVPQMPYLGHSFDLLSTAVAAKKAMLPSPTVQSPTSPVFSPTVTFSPQLLPLGPTSVLDPPTQTGHPPASSHLYFSYPSTTYTAVNRESYTVSGPSPYVHDQKTRLHASFSLDTGDDQATSGMGSSIPSTSSDSSPTSLYSDLHLMIAGHEVHVQNGVVVMVEPSYDRPRDKEACMRCGKKVFAMEKLGPVKDVLYHKTCFTCVTCHTTLTLKNFHCNDANLADLNVYCGSHKPSAKSNPLDASAVGIHRALTAPRQGRVNQQIRGGPEASMKCHLDSKSISIRAAVRVPAPDRLQASIKQREGAWYREQRKSESMPPQGVVKHD